MSAYTKGQVVTFDGIESTVVKTSIASTGVQLVTVSNYRGSFMIGALHSKLSAR